jgi:hypothetical protein
MKLTNLKPEHIHQMSYLLSPPHLLKIVKRALPFMLKADNKNTLCFFLYNSFKSGLNLIIWFLIDFFHLSR